MDSVKCERILYNTILSLGVDGIFYRCDGYMFVLPLPRKGIYIICVRTKNMALFRIGATAEELPHLMRFISAYGIQRGAREMGRLVELVETIPIADLTEEIARQKIINWIISGERKKKKKVRPQIT